MMVLITERVPKGLRGELSRWLIEPRAGVFVGRVSARVREKLWERARKGARDGSAMLIWRANNEQGFEIATHGDPSRTPTDWEGLKLITMRHDRYPNRKRKPKTERASALALRPTHVGVNRTTPAKCVDCFDAPHTRGGEPNSAHIRF